MENNDILLAIQESVRVALSESATAEIDKLKHKFECEMGKIKNTMIGNIINQIEIATRHDPINNQAVIQVVLNKQTVDPTPQGEWIDIEWLSGWQSMSATCSNCNTSGDIRYKKNEYGMRVPNSPRCPVCGAKMRNG